MTKGNCSAWTRTPTAIEQPASAERIAGFARIDAMNIVLNGVEREVDAGTSLTGLLEEAGYAQRRVAVEINREIVPRSRYEAQMIGAGDRIEIVHAIGGG